MVDGHHRHQPFFVSVVAVDLAGHPAFAEGDDPIGHRHHFRQIGGDHNHRHALFRHVKQHLVHFRFGPHVDAARRLIDDQHPRVERHAAREDHLLLVAAGELAHLLRAVDHFDLQRLAVGLNQIVLFAGVYEPAPLQQRGEAGERQVVANRQPQHRPLFFAVFRHQRHALIESIQRVARLVRHAVQLKAARGKRISAKQAAGHFGTSRAHQPGNA